MTPLSDAEIEKVLEIVKERLSQGTTLITGSDQGRGRELVAKFEHYDDAKMVCDLFDLAPRLATELKAAREKLTRIQALVDAQAKDDWLWFPPDRQLPDVDYVLEAFRKLHEVVEGKSMADCAREAIERIE